MKAFNAARLLAIMPVLVASVPGCSVIVVAADVAVSGAVAVVGTAADLTVAGVKAVTDGGGSDEAKKSE